MKKSEKSMRTATGELYLAAYGFSFRIGLTLLALAASVVVVATALTDNESPGAEPLFSMAAMLFAVLALGLVATLWRNRVSFRKDELVITSMRGTVKKSYYDLVQVDRTADALELHFKDGSKARINRHMANLTIIAALLSRKSNMQC
jgi:hypothetical protein